MMFGLTSRRTAFLTTRCMTAGIQVSAARPVLERSIPVKTAALDDGGGNRVPENAGCMWWTPPELRGELIGPMTHNWTHLRELESESIHILRETVAQFR